MIAHPARVVNMLWFKNPLKDVAVAPNATNTDENPRMNNAVRPTTLFIETLPSASSAMSYPDMSDT